jgi:hypothetical protein
VSDDDERKLDYLAQFRGGDEEHVENAQMLTVTLLRPKPIDGNAYNHISFAYSLLNRVDYFSGRRGEPKGEERIQLTFVNGVVVVSGYFLEKLHRRILRREVETIREVIVKTDEELEAIRLNKDQRCTVVSAAVWFTDDEHENDPYPESEDDDELFSEDDRSDV